MNPYLFACDRGAAVLIVPPGTSADDWETLQREFAKACGKRDPDSWVSCYPLHADQYCRGVFWDEELAGPDGISVLLLPFPNATEEDVKAVGRLLRNTRDVVRSRVLTVKWLGLGRMTQQVDPLSITPAAKSTGD